MPVQLPGELGVAGLVGCDAPELPRRSSRRSALRLHVGDERSPGLRDTPLPGVLECDLEQAARAARCEVVAYRLCPASQSFRAHDPCVPDFVPSRAPQPIRKAAADRRAPELSRQCAKTPNAPGFVGGRPGVPRAGSCSVSAGTCSTGGSRSPARVTPTFTRQRLGVRAGNVYEILALFVRGRAADAARSCLRAPARASTRDHLSAVPGRPHRVPFDRAVLLAAQGQALVALGATARDDLTNDVGALHDPVHLYLSVPITLVPAALTPDDSDPREDPIERQREDRKSTRLNSSHSQISYAVFCLKKKTQPHIRGCTTCQCTRPPPFFLRFGFLAPTGTGTSADVQLFVSPVRPWRSVTGLADRFMN